MFFVLSDDVIIETRVYNIILDAITTIITNLKLIKLIK